MLESEATLRLSEPRLSAQPSQLSGLEEGPLARGSNSAGSTRGRWSVSREDQLQEFFSNLLPCGTATASTCASSSAFARRGRTPTLDRLNQVWTPTDKHDGCLELIARLLSLTVGVPVMMLALSLPIVLDPGPSNVTVVWYACLAVGIFLHFGSWVLMVSFGECDSRAARATWCVLFAAAMCILLVGTPGPGAVACQLGIHVCSLLCPAACLVVRLLLEREPLHQVFYHFLLLQLCLVPPAVGLGLYICMWHRGWADDFALTLLASAVWGMVSVLAKPLGYWLAPRGSPYQKGVGALLFSIYIELAVGIFGLPLFMGSLRAAVLYAGMMTPAVVLQFLRGLQSYYARMPKALQASRKLHLHRMMIYFEVFASFLSRVIAYVLYFALQLVRAIRDSSEAGRTRRCPADLLWSTRGHASSDVSLAAVGIAVTVAIFLVFCTASNLAWKQSAMVAPAPAQAPSDVSSPQGNEARSDPDVIGRPRHASESFLSGSSEFATSTCPKELAAAAAARGELPEKASALQIAPRRPTSVGSAPKPSPLDTRTGTASLESLPDDDESDLASLASLEDRRAPEANMERHASTQSSAVMGMVSENMLQDLRAQMARGSGSKESPPQDSQALPQMGRRESHALRFRSALTEFMGRMGSMKNDIMHRQPRASDLGPTGTGTGSSPTGYASDPGASIGVAVVRRSVRSDTAERQRKFIEGGYGAFFFHDVVMLTNIFLCSHRCALTASVAFNFAVPVVLVDLVHRLEDGGSAWVTAAF